jgi:hypothetical protein
MTFMQRNILMPQKIVGDITGETFGPGNRMTNSSSPKQPKGLDIRDFSLTTKEAKWWSLESSWDPGWKPTVPTS